MKKRIALVKAAAAALILMFALICGCSASSGCKEGYREYNGRCIPIESDYDSADERPVDEDGDIEDAPDNPGEDDSADKTDDETTETLDNVEIEEEQTFVTKEMTHAGNCGDPEPLSLEWRVHADLSKGTNALQTEQQCKLIDAGVAWDGPEQIFSIEFTEELLAGGTNFGVYLQLDAGVKFAYSFSMFIDRNHVFKSTCGKDPNSYCQQQAVYAEETNQSSALRIWSLITTPVKGEFAHIILDSRSTGSKIGKAGGYQIWLERIEPPCVTNEERCADNVPQRCGSDKTWVKKGNKCLAAETCVVENELAVCKVVEIDGDDETAETETSEGETDAADAEETAELEREEEADIEPLFALTALSKHTINGLAQNGPIQDLCWYKVDSGGSAGMRFAAIQNVPGATESAVFSTDNFTGLWNSFSKTNFSNQVLGGLAYTANGNLIYAVNVDGNEGNPNQRMLLGAYAISYPEPVQTVDALAVTNGSKIWLAAEHQLWLLASDGSFNNYVAAGYPNNYYGLALVQSMSGVRSLLVLTRENDNSKNYVLWVEEADPTKVKGAVELPFLVNGIAYDENASFRLWGAPADPATDGYIVQFSCLPFDVKCK